MVRKRTIPTWSVGMVSRGRDREQGDTNEAMDEVPDRGKNELVCALRACYLPPVVSRRVASYLAASRVKPGWHGWLVIAPRFSVLISHCRTCRPWRDSDCGAESH